MHVRSLIAATLILVGGSTGLYAQLTPDSPSTEWTPLAYPSLNPELGDDQQTGGAEADIVGDATHTAFCKNYAADATASPTGGWLGFRLRVGADENPPGYKSIALVGMDADMDGSLDLFMGVANQGNMADVAIWAPGTSANTSPNTTSLLTPAVRTYAETAANYSFAPVTLAIDPLVTNMDLDGGGKTDYFLSFVLPFADVVAELEARGISGFTKDSPMYLIAATSGQQNSLNQDINGVTGNLNSAETWATLGGYTLVYTPASLEPVPEPQVFSVVLVGLMLLVAKSVFVRR